MAEEYDSNDPMAVLQSGGSVGEPEWDDISSTVSLDTSSTGASPSARQNPRNPYRQASRRRRTQDGYDELNTEMPSPIQSVSQTQPAYQRIGRRWNSTQMCSQRHAQWFQYQAKDAEVLMDPEDAQYAHGAVMAHFLELLHSPTTNQLSKKQLRFIACRRGGMDIAEARARHRNGGVREAGGQRRGACYVDDFIARHGSPQTLAALDAQDTQFLLEYLALQRKWMPTFLPPVHNSSTTSGAAAGAATEQGVVSV